MCICLGMPLYPRPVRALRPARCTQTGRRDALSFLCCLGALLECLGRRRTLGARFSHLLTTTGGYAFLLCCYVRIQARFLSHLLSLTLVAFTYSFAFGHCLALRTGTPIHQAFEKRSRLTVAPFWTAHFAHALEEGGSSRAISSTFWASHYSLNSKCGASINGRLDCDRLMSM
mgnify:CR=1 FL=1